MSTKTIILLFLGLFLGTQGTMVNVVRKVLRPWDPHSEDIIIQTDSELASNEAIAVDFGDFNADTRAGGVEIRFYEFRNIEYLLTWCTPSGSAFPVTPPTQTAKTWRISYNPAQLRVVMTCNEQEVLDVVLSDGVCEVPDWRKEWEERKPTEMMFTELDNASDEYCLGESVIDKECTGLDPTWNNLKTETTFPVVRGTIVTVTCDTGYVVDGSNTVTCNQDIAYFGNQPTCKQLRGSVESIYGFCGLIREVSTTREAALTNDDPPRLILVEDSSDYFCYYHARDDATANTIKYSNKYLYLSYTLTDAVVGEEQKGEIVLKSQSKCDTDGDCSWRLNDNGLIQPEDNKAFCWTMMDVDAGRAIGLMEGISGPCKEQEVMFQFKLPANEIEGNIPVFGPVQTVQIELTSKDATATGLRYHIILNLLNKHDESVGQLQIKQKNNNDDFRLTLRLTRWSTEGDGLDRDIDCRALTEIGLPESSLPSYVVSLNQELGIVVTREDYTSPEANILEACGEEFPAGIWSDVVEVKPGLVMLGTDTDDEVEVQWTLRTISLTGPEFVSKHSNSVSLTCKVTGQTAEDTLVSWTESAVIDGLEKTQPIERGTDRYEIEDSKAEYIYLSTLVIQDVSSSHLQDRSFTCTHTSLTATRSVLPKPSTVLTDFTCSAKVGQVKSVKYGLL